MEEGVDGGLADPVCSGLESGERGGGPRWFAESDGRLDQVGGAAFAGKLVASGALAEGLEAFKGGFSPAVTEVEQAERPFGAVDARGEDLVTGLGAGL